MPGHLAQLRAVRRVSGGLSCDELPDELAERLRDVFGRWAAGTTDQ